MKTLIVSIMPSWILWSIKAAKGLAVGKWPLKISKATLRRTSNLETLSGKIRHKMAFDRNPNLTLFADKVSVRDFVRHRVGHEYLPTVHQIFESSNELTNFDFPREFALKANHGSGAMILVSELASKETKLPNKIGPNNWSQHVIQPSQFSVEKAVQFADVWLNQNYYSRVGCFPEWAYKNIDPKLILEEIMIGLDGNLPWDYKFTMIHGKCEFIQVRVEKNTRDLFDSSWNRIGGENLYRSSGMEIPAPRHLEEMLDVAKQLSNGVDFVRVDLYQTTKGVRFGELTNYPDGGIGTFRPSGLDKHLGSNWHPEY